jgi:hypothetical protein
MRWRDVIGCDAVDGAKVVPGWSPRVCTFQKLGWKDGDTDTLGGLRLLLSEARELQHPLMSNESECYIFLVLAS